MASFKLKKTLGWFLTACGIIWLFLAVLMVIEDDPDHPRAEYGGAMLTAIFLVPGTVLLVQHYAGQKSRALHEQLTGYLRSHDSFTVGEMATKIGRTEMETEALISTLMEREELALVFHRPSRSYYHRDRIRSAHGYVRQCPSCGASMPEELVFDGDHVSCVYCGVDLAAGGSG